MQKADQLYTQDIAGDFSFNEQVAEVFHDMINRSVPCYPAIINALPLVARRYVQSGTNVYDLGSSLGTATLTVRKALEKTDVADVKFIAVDNSQAMCKRLQNILDAYVSRFETQLILGDLEEVAVTNSSLVLLNFVLQFLKPQVRQEVLEKIYQGLVPGGVLILSEKFTNDDPFLQDEIQSLHWDFKRANGYSELEVQRKRTALENVMITDSMATHLQRLQAIGFKVVIWQLGFNFCSFLCYKV